MTDRITPDKLDRVADVIEQLNKELHPLVVKAVILDPNRVNMPPSTVIPVLKDLLVYIGELISMILE